MASTGKKKTTMAKLTRESRLRERKAEKDARKRARKYAAAHPELQLDEETQLDEEAQLDGDVELDPAGAPASALVDQEG